MSLGQDKRGRKEMARAEAARRWVGWLDGEGSVLREGPCYGKAMTGVECGSGVRGQAAPHAFSVAGW